MSTDVYALATAGVNRLRPYEPGKPVEELEREHGVSNAIKLASNENPLGPSPRAIQSLRAAVDGVNYYPDGQQLTAALAERLGVAPAQITLGNGSNDVLDMVARVFLGPDASAVFSAHAFAVYPIATLACSATPRVAAALPADHSAMPYGHDLDAMRAAIDDDTRVVFVANPNNPTGTWLQAEPLLAFIDALPEHVVVVLDEAYSEYVEQPDFPNGLDWLASHPNLVVTRTFSKIYGLAGLRLGYGVSSAAIADLLNRVRHPFNVNNLAIAAGLGALDDDDYVARSAALNRAGLQQLADGFRSQGLATLPSVGNFLCVDLGRDAAPVYQALLAHGVIVRPVANYQLPQHLRVTVGTETDNQRVLEAFARVLDE